MLKIIKNHFPYSGKSFLLQLLFEHPILSMTEDQLSELIQKYLSGEASKEEKKQVERWYESFDSVGIEFQGSKEEMERSLERSLLSIKEKITGEQASGWRKVVKNKPGIGFIYKYAATAAILIVVSAGIYFGFRHSAKGPSMAKKTAPEIQDILPGGNKAILTLGNGKQIILDTTNNGLLSIQGNTSVVKLNSGLLAYNQRQATSGRKPIEYNTITTPHGGKYEIVLPDGSKVWLNAASSIRFPTAFIHERREVFISGEAYFEIAKNPEKPFIVKQKNIEITVLGTSFNIMAYDEESGTRVTLVEGAVKVAQHGGDRGKLAQGIKLNPGQQLMLKVSKNGEQVLPTLKEVNVNEEIAWKDNLFWFDNDKIQEVAKKLSRWYDIDIVTQGVIPDRFTGFIPMDLPFSKVIGMLQKTGRIQYKIVKEGKVILLP